MTVLNLHKHGKPIESLESWFELAPPKEGAAQWVDRRSAKELARAFVGDGAPRIPTELQRLFSSNKHLGPVAVSEAMPEEKIPLDEFRGETRNADLALVGSSGLGTVGITVEAKADESFGSTLKGRLSQVHGQVSNVPERLRRLTVALFGEESDRLSELRYQLVHGAAASLIFAASRAAHAAVFAVFEFQSSACSRSKVQRNARDLDVFLSKLGGDPVLPEVLQGPFSVPGGGPVRPDIPLYVGKVIRRL